MSSSPQDDFGRYFDYEKWENRHCPSPDSERRSRSPRISPDASASGYRKRSPLCTDHLQGREAIGHTSDFEQSTVATPGVDYTLKEDGSVEIFRCLAKRCFAEFLKAELLEKHTELVSAHDYLHRVSKYSLEGFQGTYDLLCPVPDCGAVYRLKTADHSARPSADNFRDTKKSLILHLNFTHLGTYRKCPLCERSMREQRLSGHLRECTKLGRQMPFLCPLPSCQQSFHSDRALETHEYSHYVYKTDEGKSACHSCTENQRTFHGPNARRDINKHFLIKHGISDVREHLRQRAQDDARSPSHAPESHSLARRHSSTNFRALFMRLNLAPEVDHQQLFRETKHQLIHSHPNRCVSYTDNNVDCHTDTESDS